MFPVLETERLLYREITEGDAEKIFSILSFDEVTRHYGQESLTNINQAIEFIRHFQKKYDEKSGIRWGIERKDTRQLIGTIGFHALVSKHKRAEIGYEIHPDHWRKGFASEAVSKMLFYGFKDLGLSRIGAVVFTENAASNKLLTKMGFEQEGILRNYIYQNGSSYDTIVYSILNENELRN
jgi:[ribosomal protein S5]-alanine N-acetyltransferase